MQNHREAILQGWPTGFSPFLTADLKVNIPLAQRYECYASWLGIKFPSRSEQEDLDASASTDQGNVSYEVPAMQAVYKIEVPSGEANHTAGFAEVSQNLFLLLKLTGFKEHAGTRAHDFEFEGPRVCGCRLLE